MILLHRDHSQLQIHCSKTKGVSNLSAISILAGNHWDRLAGLNYDTCLWFFISMHAEYLEDIWAESRTEEVCLKKI